MCVGLAQITVGRHRLAHSTEVQAAVFVAKSTGRLEYIQPSISRTSGSGGDPTSRSSGMPSTMAAANRPTSAQVRGHSAERDRPLRRAAEHLDDVHRRDHQVEAPVELEIPNVPLERVHGKPLGRSPSMRWRPPGRRHRPPSRARARTGRGEGRRGRSRTRARVSGRRTPLPAPPRIRGRRSSRRIRRPARPPRRSCPVVPGQAAPGEQGSQLEEGRVGGQREEAAVGARNRVVDRALRSRDRPRSHSGAMPAYLRRTAISGARVPAQVTRRTWPARSSKSASQTHEMSRPSAIRSLSATQRSRLGSPFESDSSSRVRSTSFAPAGFLIRRIESSLPATGTVSTRPNTARIASMRARRVRQRQIPAACAAVSAASAL